MDVSDSSSEALKQFTEENGLLYSKIEIGIIPALRLFDKYLDLRNSTDTVIIFEDIRSN